MMDPKDPQRMQAHMMKWKTWMDGLAAKGKYLGGDPLEDGGRTLHGKAMKTTDGPFAEGKEVVGGYMMINAASFDEAAELSKGCPIFENDGTVEVRRVQEVNM